MSKIHALAPCWIIHGFKELIILLGTILHIILIDFNIWTLVYGLIQTLSVVAKGVGYLQYSACLLGSGVSDLSLFAFGVDQLMNAVFADVSVILFFDDSVYVFVADDGVFVHDCASVWEVFVRHVHDVQGAAFPFFVVV